MATRDNYFRVRVPLLRRIDRLIRQGLVPFDSPEEFVEEAVRRLVVEMEARQRPLFDVAEDRWDQPRMSVERDQLWRATPSSDRLMEAPRRAEGVRLSPKDWARLAVEAGVEPIFDAQETALAAPQPGVVFDTPDGVVADEPLFGLHNRDYPSLWAVARLCEWTRHEPIPLREFRSRATDEAARFSLSLQALETRRPKGQPRLTALFPRPTLPFDAREPSRTYVEMTRGGGAFEQAALGSVHRDTGSSELRLHGPLFAWRLAALDRTRPDGLLAPTELAYSLLRSLGGITIEMPHERDHAYAFFEHLRHHAQGDWQAFTLLISGIADRIPRDELVERFKRRFRWRGSVPQTNFQGYLGRAREWGIVTQGRGQYQLTELGVAVANSLI
jgi:hypothetical protein